MKVKIDGHHSMDLIAENEFERAWLSNFIRTFDGQEVVRSIMHHGKTETPGHDVKLFQGLDPEGKLSKNDPRFDDMLTSVRIANPQSLRKLYGE